MCFDFFAIGALRVNLCVFRLFCDWCIKGLLMCVSTFLRLVH